MLENVTVLACVLFPTPLVASHTSPSRVRPQRRQAWRRLVDDVLQQIAPGSGSDCQDGATSPVLIDVVDSEGPVLDPTACPAASSFSVWFHCGPTLLILPAEEVLQCTILVALHFFRASEVIGLAVGGLLRRGDTGLCMPEEPSPHRTILLYSSICDIEDHGAGVCRDLSVY